MKTPHLFFCGLGLIALALSVNACGKSKSVPVHSPGGGGGNPTPIVKPIFDTPPHYSEKQFEVGQWIQWSKTSNNGLKGCERWTVIKIKEYTTELKGELSKDCTNWKDSIVERVVFITSTGRVHENTIHIPDEKPTTGSRVSIYNRWYGSAEKIKHVLGRSSFGDQFFKAFQLEGEKEEYLNIPDHAFHSVALRFQEETDGLQWKYEYMQAHPEIPFIEEEPK